MNRGRSPGEITGEKSRGADHRGKFPREITGGGGNHREEEEITGGSSPASVSMYVCVHLNFHITRLHKIVKVKCTYIYKYTFIYTIIHEQINICMVLHCYGFLISFCFLFGFYLIRLYSRS